MNYSFSKTYYYVTLIFCLGYSFIKADALDEYKKKVQYDQAITYLTLDFEQWQLLNKKINVQSEFATEQEREELEIARLLQKSERKDPILPYTTLAGKFGLYHILFNPTTDIAILQKRQQFIKVLTQDSAFYTKLQKLLKELATYELECFSYWSPQDSLTQRASSIYFSQPETFFGLCKLPQFTEKLNQSSAVLELSTLKEFFKKIWLIIPFLGLDGVADNFQGALLGNNEFNPLTGLAQGLKQKMYDLKNQYNFSDVNHAGLQKFYNHIDNGFENEETGKVYHVNKRTGAFILGSSFLFSGHRTAGDRTDIGQNIFRKNNITISYPIAAGLTLGRSLLVNYLMYVLLQDQIQAIKNTYKTLQQLHTRTVAVSKYLKTIEQIEKLLETSSNQHVQLFYRDCLLSKKAASKKLKSVFTLLQTDTFTKDGCAVYLRGKVLLAHKLLQEVHTELTDRIRNIALIDAHMAVATFMKESAVKQMPTCFVEFVDDNQPIELTLTNGWSPLIICQKQVCNSLSLGSQGARTVILTGPNGCGKSTILRVLGIAAWLTQTFGVAPAEYARISLFNSIRTSLRINDNAATGLSTYMAADAAAERIQTHIDQSHEKHRSLILYGEPYRGTPDQETTRKIMDFCHHVASNQHFLMALETHVYEPTLLEKDMPHIFTNGHMEINEDVDGSFIRTFTLKKGPANWWFLDHAKRRRFVDWITVVRKQEEIAQKAYEAALMQAYEMAVAQAKQDQEERIKKENATSYVRRTVNGIKSLFI